MKKIILLALLAVACYLPGMVSAAPVITTLSNSTLPQAGRLKISGQNFGALQGTGTVTIGGVIAPVSKWSATSITAYIPDATSLGLADVQVVTTSGSSNTLSLIVTARVADGQVLWRFQADDLYIKGRPAVGPDGTIYALSISGHLFALEPDGGIKWIFNAYGSEQSVSVGNDGTIYFAGLSTIYALNPNGTLKWTVTNTFGLIDVGPNVGPDGNIYAVTSEGGETALGAFSISPDGNILWNVPGFVHGYGEAGSTKEVVFGSGQLYFCMNNLITNNHGLQAITLDGDQMWTKLAFDQPAVAPDGRVYANTQASELSSFHPDGNLIEKFSGYSGPCDVGSDGIFYVGTSFPGAKLTAVNPEGDVQWQIPESGFIDGPIVSPANDLVVICGYEIGSPGYVDAVNTNGLHEWKINLPEENGGFVSAMSRPRFSLDGSVVYIGMDVNDGAADPYTYLYAIATGSTSCVAPAVSISAAGATTFCNGESVTINSSVIGSTVTYQWKNGSDISGATNSSYTATTSGNYSVSVFNACGSDISNTISVTVKNNPKAKISPSGTVFMCDGDQTVLAANTGNNLSYQWIKNGNNINGATSSLYTATTNGKYSVKVTKNSSGCSSISAITKVKINCKAINAEQISPDNLIQVYPNPSAGEFTVKFDDGNVYDVQISDALGRILKSYNHIESSLSFGIDLKPGMYFLQVNLNNSPVKVIKLIKTQH